ncbi:MAG: hypothetical protein V1494_05215 [Candidatus Diapherotrites archaeon]
MGYIVIRPIYDPATDFAQTLASQIIEALEKKEIKPRDYYYKDATKKKIHKFLLDRRNGPSAIFGFGHGDRRTFYGHNEEPIFTCNQTSNKKIFFGSFFYLYSCNCGKELGKKIVDAGGKGFLGYVGIVCYHPRNPLPIIRSANKGILAMIKKGCSLKSAYDITIKAYGEEIKKAEKSKKFWLYETLKTNRENFVKYGRDRFFLSTIA